MISFTGEAIVAWLLGRRVGPMQLAELPVTSGRGARLAARADALATRRSLWVAGVVAGLIVVAAFFGLKTYPNYDSYYQLLWGRQLSTGHLPDYSVFRSAALEVARPRRGWPVLLLLALAGLLRPEAWVLSGAYVLWLLPEKGLRGIWPYALLAASGPAVWFGWDWIVTGKPLYSLTSTRETAGAFGRNRGFVGAVKLIPDYIGANEKIVNDSIGG